MKTQEILARVNDAMAPYAAIERGSCNAEGIAFDIKTRLDLLAADLEAQLRQEIASAKGTGNATRTVTAMLNAVKRNDTCRTSLHYAWTDKQGRQCVCDGYRAFRLNEPLELEPRPADADEPIDLDKIVPDTSADGWLTMPLPTVKEVKAHVAVERAKNRRGGVIWDFGEGRPAVNAAYLIDALTVLPDAAEVFYRPGVGLLSPLVFKAANGDGVLLPVRTERVMAEYEKARNAEQLAREEARRAERDAVERRKFHAAVLEDLLRNYREKAAKDAAYSLTPDEFANMAQYAA